MNAPGTILVTGGTGTLGEAFADLASAAGFPVRIMSRREQPAVLPPGREWVRADLTTGEGLEQALGDVSAILHAATDPRGDPEATDVEGTKRLLDGADKARVRHLVYPSIVGIDDLPFGYYDSKLRAEAIIQASGVPYTTVRITQFHSFVDEILSFVGWLPVLPLPTRARIQSIAVEEAAEHLLERLRAGPDGRALDVGGPEVLKLGEMARVWCRARDRRRWIMRLPVPGGLARGFREGRATVPERRVGTTTWKSWLDRRYRH